MKTEEYNAIMKELADIKQQLNNLEQRLPLPVTSYTPVVSGQIGPDDRSRQITMNLDG